MCWQAACRRDKYDVKDLLRSPSNCSCAVKLPRYGTQLQQEICRTCVPLSIARPKGMQDQPCPGQIRLVLAMISQSKLCDSLLKSWVASARRL